MDGQLVFRGSDPATAGLGIFGVDPNGSNLQPIFPDTASQRGSEPAVSPGGTRLALLVTDTASGSTKLDVRQADGSLISLSLGDGVRPADPIWSPDGTKIAFSATSTVTLTRQIYVTNADGSGAAADVTDPDTEDMQPAWSTTGQIAFATLTRETCRDQVARAPNWEIWSVRPDGSNLRRVTPTCADDGPASGPANETDPAWSPDGTQLAFVSGSRGSRGPGIYTVFVRGATGPTQLTDQSGDEFPSWSPDGKQIAFERRGDLYVVPPGTLARVDQPSFQGAVSRPSWGGLFATLGVGTNRDGVTNFASEAGQDKATRSSALVMASYDEASETGGSDSISFTAGGKPVNENQTVRPGDASYMTPILIRHPAISQVAAAGLKLLLSTSSEAVKGFALFRSMAAGTDSVWGGIKERNTEVDVTPYLKDQPAGTSAVAFGIEGLFFRNLERNAYGGTFPDGFDGRIPLNLEEQLPGGTTVVVDRAVLQVAPLIMLPNTQPAQQVWVADDRPFNGPLIKALETHAGPRTYQLETYRFSKGSNDQWTQDHIAVGYTAAPGDQSLSVALALPHFHPHLPTWPEKQFLGKGHRVFTLGYLGGGQGDYGGNLGVVPPTPAYPLGRIVHGNTMSRASSAFWDDQKVQDPFTIDTSWLAVGHVDEVVGFVPAPGGFKLVEASPDLAVCLLGGQASAPGKDLERKRCAPRNLFHPPGSEVLFAEGKTADGQATAAATAHDELIDSHTDFAKGPWQYVRIYAGRGAGQIAHIKMRLDGKLVVDEVWNTGTHVVAAPGTSCAAGRCYFPDPPLPRHDWFVDPASGSKFVILADTLRKTSLEWGYDVPAAITVSELRSDRYLWRLNRDAQTVVEKDVKTIEHAAGIKVPVVPVPTIYKGELTPSGGLVEREELAYTPNLANFQPAGPVTFFPEVFGPKARGTDLFEKVTREAIPNALFVNDWTDYHAEDGEIHCGTYVVRAPYAFNWWTAEPQDPALPGRRALQERKGFGQHGYLLPRAVAELAHGVTHL